MKRTIIGIFIGSLITCMIVFAADILMDAKSVSYTSEYTDKTNVADALTEILNSSQGSLVCPDGYNCEYTPKSYTVTYNVNGGTMNYTNDNFMYNETYSGLEIPSKSGYAFGGWFLDEEFTKYVGETTKVKTKANHALYAMWGSPVEITFEANGGKLTTGTKEVTQNGRYGTLPRGYKEGYVLEGWYSDSELTNKVEESPKVTNASNHTLYAKWVESTKPTLYDVVLSKLDTSKKSQAMNYGSTQSDLGVYEYDGPKSSDGGELPIYFYRGNVTDNNVLFAGYCWKIIRTTGTGGTKLLYSGLPTGTAPNYVCNNTGENAQVTTKNYNGASKKYWEAFYVYDKDKLHGVSTSSDIKKYIEGISDDSWFPSSNISSKNIYDMLEDHPYCMDRRYFSSGYNSLSTSTDVSSVMYYGGTVRMTGIQKPWLDCYHNNQTDTDKLTVRGGQLKKKVALITSDEIMLAGGGQFNNTNYYLYTGVIWWGLSPYQVLATGVPYVFHVYSNGSTSYYGYGPEQSVGVRPVVSLKLDSKISGGNGSTLTPYIINPN